MFYTVYKTTNKINGKIYIGCHKTENLDDGYMGSGKILKRAITKHGLDNFTKEILHVFTTSEEMFETEKMLVVLGPSSYNLKEGGSGGFDYINRLGVKAAYPSQASISALKTYRYSPLGKPLSEETKRKISLNHARAMLGKHHSDVAKKNIGEKNSKRQSGSGNSQYGMMWITNGRESTRIRKSDSIPEGFRKGRIVSRTGSN